MTTSIVISDNSESSSPQTVNDTLPKTLSSSTATCSATPQYRTLTLTKNVPFDYPPVEGNADIAIPLHWEPIRNTLGLGTVPNRIYSCSEYPLQELLARIAHDLDKLQENFPGGMESFDKGLWTIASGDKQLEHYLIELEEHDKENWKLIEGQVRRILFKHFRNVVRGPPPLRYTIWVDDSDDHCRWD